MVAAFNCPPSFLNKQVEAVVIGLGAGLLPMFLHNHIQFLQMEVILIHIPSFGYLLTA